MVKNYFPKQGDIVYLSLDPTKGHEQKGVRPALVVSNNVFNQNTHMVMVCPITSNQKEFPTHYLLEDTKKIYGSVLCEHIRSIDYDRGVLNFVERVSDNDLLSVMMLLNACMEE